MKSRKPSRAPGGAFDDGGGALPSGLPPKQERLGLSEKKMRDAQKIAAHPDIV